MSRVLHGLSGGALVALLLVPPSTASAQAIRALTGSSTLAANDDSYTGLVPLGFTINFYGSPYSGLYVNNNGNVTFSGPLGTYTPFPILTTGVPMLAPFFGDVDTRTGNLVNYGTTAFGSHAAFVVNWPDVGYFATHTNLLNNFQLLIVDRSDIASGDFDFEFNYQQMQWETGDASGGSGGLGGSCARMGWSNGVAAAYETPGSAVCGALIDGGANALIANSLNSGVDGRYDWSVRSGVVDSVVPEPATMTLLATGLVGLAGFRRRKRHTLN